ncbi:endonuclease MutS2 [Bacillus horti]|uniref:MutS2 family protein n=1 Tax=Caldalkalibacillus horti TaxID=77523 RepID=A0ABT9VXD4_9BACI|nr:hypothetical protein [Bacillus horti]MDQ0165652.1 MutS2 family protein [Bacillus horti]
MQQRTSEALEFNRLKEIMMDFAVSEQAKAMIRNLQPSTSAKIITNQIKETTEAKAILQKSSSVPLQSLSGMERLMSGIGKGVFLNPEQLMQVWTLLDHGKKMIRFMKDKETIAPQVSTYAQSIAPLPHLADEIERCIRNGRVDDAASKALAKIRKRMNMLEIRIKEKLEKMVRASNQYFQDHIISVRDGRYVIPVKSEYKKNIDGQILDQSSSGSTVYVEPADVRKLQNEVHMEKVAEDVEVQRILSTLTGMVETHEHELSINIETFAHYDFIFAKAKYSQTIGGQAVEVNTNQIINIVKARHPLIKNATPLDFRIGNEYRALVITGPNTGGKTVAIKTIGLLTLMVQSGMHVPVAEGSEMAIFEDILVDIGDGQSIEQSLSTFSAHLTNIIQILKQAHSNTLVILDELGAGTDPAEGKGLALAILEKLAEQEATLLATTHYSEMKEFAQRHSYFENGSMEFDIESLQPLYRLTIGRAGESQAFSIALKLGMDRKVLERAHELTHQEIKDYGRTEGIETIPDYKKQLRKTKEDERGEMKEESRSHTAINKNKESNERVTNITKKPTETATQMEKETEKQMVEHTANSTLLEENQQQENEPLQLGDRVYVNSLKTYGIVCETENHRGEVGVLIKHKKVTINKKRLKLQGKAQDLYPENYDLSIVLKSKEARKKSKLLGKRHVENVTIEYNEDGSEKK